MPRVLPTLMFFITKKVTQGAVIPAALLMQTFLLRTWGVACVVLGAGRLDLRVHRASPTPALLPASGHSSVNYSFRLKPLINSGGAFEFLSNLIML